MSLGAHCVGFSQLLPLLAPLSLSLLPYVSADNKFSSRLTFFDRGAIVLSSGSSPPLQAGSTIYIGVTSLLFSGSNSEGEKSLERPSVGVGRAQVKLYRLSVKVIPKKQTVQFAIVIAFLCVLLLVLGWLFAACSCLYPCCGRHPLSKKSRRAWRESLRPYWRADDLEEEEVGWTGCGHSCLKRAISSWFHTKETGRGKTAIAVEGNVMQMAPERPYSYSSDTKSEENSSSSSCPAHAP